MKLIAIFSSKNAFRSSIKILVLPLVIVVCIACGEKSTNEAEEDWIAIFDGSNYGDWTPKFTGAALGVNYRDRFVYDDGLLSVRYAKTDTFKGNFGHLFYKEKFSHYKLRATYRFVGDQMTDGPAWAFRNNGLMLHCQEPGTLGLDQDFPISLELQLLGGDDNQPRTTANLCTPGTNVVLNDSLFTTHCVNSVSNTYHGDQWVTVEVLVLGDSLIQHKMEDKVVMAYSSPTIGGGNIAGYLDSAFKEGEALKEGYIAIQAESHPIDFKRIEVLNLCGCMDEKAKNYKSYYIKPDNSTCIYE
ncbi:3-keto-disaccharide hydrolase [Maribacter confluentis]